MRMITDRDVLDKVKTNGMHVIFDLWPRNDSFKEITKTGKLYIRNFKYKKYEGCKTAGKVDVSN